MDGREGITIPRPSAPSYYLNNSGGIVGSGYKPHSNPNDLFQSSHVIVSDDAMAAAFQTEHPSHCFPHSGRIKVKKKRGRPRKYTPDKTNMSLALSPLSTTPSSGALTSSGLKRNRGRPRGSGWKQQLASLGEWMNRSAGLAFTPHVILVSVGEDVAAKILSFAQQRPRALCILSASGSVSAVTFRVASGGTVTYEGRFEVLCLSGSYLLDEDGGPRDRTGGISISVCSPDGHVIGGAVGGRLTAATPVQVIACSFVYGGKARSKTEASAKGENISIELAEDFSTPIITASGYDQARDSATGVCRPESRSSNTEIDLTRG